MHLASQSAVASRDCACQPVHARTSASPSEPPLANPQPRQPAGRLCGLTRRETARCAGLATRPPMRHQPPAFRPISSSTCTISRAWPVPGGRIAAVLRIDALLARLVDQAQPRLEQARARVFTGTAICVVRVLTEEVQALASMNIALSMCAANPKASTSRSWPVPSQPANCLRCAASQSRATLRSCAASARSSWKSVVACRRSTPAWGSTAPAIRRRSVLLPRPSPPRTSIRPARL
jgi:hypothetical protein